MWHSLSNGDQILFRNFFPTAYRSGFTLTLLPTSSQTCLSLETAGCSMNWSQPFCSFLFEGSSGKTWRCFLVHYLAEGWTLGQLGAYQRVLHGTVVVFLGSRCQSLCASPWTITLPPPYLTPCLLLLLEEPLAVSCSPLLHFMSFTKLLKCQQNWKNGVF